jgi:high affinity Mn2+ porin
VADIFDNNTYSHDPRTQFWNWSLMSAGAWDYAANTRGYTWGAAAEYHAPQWALRLGAALEPETANGPYMDMNISKANALMIELERSYSLLNKKGKIRLIGFHNSAFMGSYSKTLQDTNLHLDVTRSRSYSNDKSGFALNLEQSLSENSGLFARLSWNDGKNETWAFTEIDKSFSLGFVNTGAKWKRPADHFGIAIVVNGLSDLHRDYLATGGVGFIIGDGKLNYAPEQIAEINYNISITPQFSLCPDYQFVLNPAYNRDRGPIHLLGLRAHAEF